MNIAAPKTIWFISDTHFSHENFLKFRGVNGELIRPFASIEEMNELMVERWNKTVRPRDHVYHCGDVAMRAPHLDIVKRLNGKKRLIRGNHDIFPTKRYLNAGFEEIHGCRVLANVIFTHIPIHPLSLGRFVGNAHGHIHERSAYGPNYLNLSVEAIDYTPLSLEEVVARLVLQQSNEAA